MPHIHEFIDYTVIAYVVHGDRVLLILHKELKKWLPVGGHIELDEDPDQALAREAMEESGIDPQHLSIASSRPDFVSAGYKPLFTPNFLDIHEISGNHRHVGLIYVLKTETDNITLADQEHDEIRWFRAPELEMLGDRLKSGTKFYATEALRIAHDPKTVWQTLVS